MDYLIWCKMMFFLGCFGLGYFTPMCFHAFDQSKRVTPMFILVYFVVQVAFFAGKLS